MLNQCTSKCIISFFITTNMSWNVKNKKKNYEKKNLDSISYRFDGEYFKVKKMENIEKTDL